MGAGLHSSAGTRGKGDDLPGCRGPLGWTPCVRRRGTGAAGICGATGVRILAVTSRTRANGVYARLPVALMCHSVEFCMKPHQGGLPVSSPPFSVSAFRRLRRSQWRISKCQFECLLPQKPNSGGGELRSVRCVPAACTRRLAIAGLAATAIATGCGKAAAPFHDVARMGLGAGLLQNNPSLNAPAAMRPCARLTRTFPRRCRVTGPSSRSPPTAARNYTSLQTHTYGANGTGLAGQIATVTES